jgi:L-amino acid N-acyltransferase YncA
VLHGVATYEINPQSEKEMRARFETIIGSGYPYMVAVDAGGTIIGYAYASGFRTRTAYRFLVEDSIYLAPEARGKGAGKALLVELVRRCTELGFRQMVAVIGDSGNRGSIGLHEAAGFKKVAVLPAIGLKFGRWVDSVMMQRPLGEGQTTLPAEPAGR